MSGSPRAHGEGAHAHSPLPLKYFIKVQTAACCSSSIVFGSRCKSRISEGFFSSKRSPSGCGCGGAASAGSAALTLAGDLLRGVERPGLPALQHPAADFHPRVVRGVEKERHALLHDRVRGREGLPERLVEMRRRRGFEVDREDRAVLLPEQLQKRLTPASVGLGVHERPKALGGASLVLDQAEKAERVGELRPDHAGKASEHAAVDARGKTVLTQVLDERPERPVRRVRRRSQRSRAFRTPAGHHGLPPVRNTEYRYSRPVANIPYKRTVRDSSKSRVAPCLIPAKILTKLQIFPERAGRCDHFVRAGSDGENMRTISRAAERGPRSRLESLRMMWTEEAVESLRKLALEGMSASVIAAALGAESRNAVIGKANRIGVRLAGVGGRAPAAGRNAAPLARLLSPWPIPRSTAGVPSPPFARRGDPPGGLRGPKSGRCGGCGSRTRRRRLPVAARRSGRRRFRLLRTRAGRRALVLRRPLPNGLPPARGPGGPARARRISPCREFMATHLRSGLQAASPASSRSPGSPPGPLRRAVRARSAA